MGREQQQSSSRLSAAGSTVSSPLAISVVWCVCNALPNFLVLRCMHNAGICNLCCEVGMSNLTLNCILLLCCRLDSEQSSGHFSGVVCVQCAAPLPGAVVCADWQGHEPAVPVPLLHPVVLLLWQHCCWPHLGSLPSQLQLQGRHITSLDVMTITKFRCFSSLLFFCGSIAVGLIWGLFPRSYSFKVCYWSSCVGRHENNDHNKVMYYCSIPVTIVIVPCSNLVHGAVDWFYDSRGCG